MIANGLLHNENKSTYVYYYDTYIITSYNMH